MLAYEDAELTFFSVHNYTATYGTIPFQKNLRIV